MKNFDAELAHPDPEVRRSWIASLREVTVASGIADIIFRALGDDDFSVRREAIQLADAKADDPSVGTALTRALKDESSLARRSAAMEAVGRVGASILPLLRELLDDNREGVRRLAVDSIGSIEHPSAFEVLAVAVQDSSPAVRAAAAEALGRTDASRAMPVLQKLLRDDTSASVRLSALLSAETLDAPLDATLLSSLARNSLTAPSALRQLGRIGEPEPLVRALLTNESARQRAALVGLTEAFDIKRDRTIEAIASGSQQALIACARGWVQRRDPNVAAGALLVGAALGDIESFAFAVTRNDRTRLNIGILRAVLALQHPDPDAALDQLAQELDDDAATELLNEARDYYRSQAPRRPRFSPLGDTRSERRPPTLPRVVLPTVPRTKTPKSTKATKRPEVREAHVDSTAPTPKQLTSATFERLARALERIAGLSFDKHAAYRLEARLGPRVTAVGASSFEEYATLLEGSTRDAASEARTAVERLTVHETYFYREKAQLEAFTKEILPEFVKTRTHLRVWSAGCSTGEEGWTLAMLLEDFCNLNPGFRWEVHGTDLISRVVEQANAGVYGKRSFRGELPLRLRKRYVKDIDTNRGRIVDRLRDRVRFTSENLVSAPTTDRAYDAIFCRNVLIYLSRDARRQVIERFYQSLKPGGVLFLGHSESLFSLETNFRLLPLSRELAYARPPAPDIAVHRRSRR